VEKVYHEMMFITDVPNWKLSKNADPNKDEEEVTVPSIKPQSAIFLSMVRIKSPGPSPWQVSALIQ
jgi:hypothetical protein